jgi:hypothetical protein
MPAIATDSWRRRRLPNCWYIGRGPVITNGPYCVLLLLCAEVFVSVVVVRVCWREFRGHSLERFCDLAPDLSE